MKKYKVLYILLLLFGVSIYSQEMAERETGQKFGDWFMKQRMYPADTLRTDAYSNLITNVNSLSELESLNPESGTWINVGPKPGTCSYGGEISGRVSTVFYHPTIPNIIFIGGANGGVWKTTDGGFNWNEKYNGLTSLASGSLVIDPVNPNNIYYGTGEGGHIYTYYGMGIFYSRDGGETWSLSTSNPSLNITTVNKIVINPFNRNELLAAVSAHSFNIPNPAGVYKSVNAGETWTRIYPPIGDPGLSCTDVAYSPTIENKIFIVGPQNHNAPNYWDNGVDFRLSTDGGSTFSNPMLNIVRYRSKISISSDGNTIYVLTADYVNDLEHVYLYKSESGGISFSLKPEPVDYGWGAGQAYYNMCLKVSPHDANLLFIGISNMYRSTNGGDQTYEVGGYHNLGPHPDFHAIDFSLTNPDEVVIGCDGGVWKSLNRGSTGSWINLNHNLSLTGFYRITSNPYNNDIMLGGSQDNGLQTKASGTSWVGSHTGDFGEVIIDEINPDHIIGQYCNCPYCGIGNATQVSTNGGVSWSSSWGGLGTWDNSSDWLMAIAPNVVNPGEYYLARTQNYGANSTIIFRSTNYGVNWLTIDNQYGLPGSSIQNIAVSESNPAVLYASNGLFQFWPGTVQWLYKSSNTGVDWEGIRIDQHGAPNKYISSIEVDPQNSEIVYLTLTSFDYSGNTGHIFKTSNGGANWIDITGNLGDLPVNDIMFYKNDNSSRYLIVGTDAGVFISDENNINWQKLGSSLPIVTVLELNYFRPQQKLKIGTHGRSAWEYDIGGDIYVDDYYTIGGNVTFDRNIIVCSGGTLKIINPVTVNFTTEKKIFIKNGGKLDVSSGSAITLTSQSGQWGGIVFENGSYGTVKNCTFNNTENNTAIFVDFYPSVDVPEHNIIIQDCHFNQGAIQVNGDNYRNVYIDNNNFDGNGIEVSYSDPVYITNNTLINTGISVSSSSLEISDNNITNSSIYLDGCYAPTIKSNTITGASYNLFLFNSSPIMFDNTFNCTDNNGISIYTNYLSFPRLRPSSANDVIIWDAGYNKINATNGGVDIFYMEGSADIDQGDNFFNAGSLYLTDYIYPTPTGNTYYATGNCWDGGATDPDKFTLHDQLGNPVSVIYATTNCTPPFSSVFNEPDIYNAGGNNSSELLPYEPPLPYIRNLGNGHYDTIQVTSGSLNLTADEVLYSSGIKEELNNNYLNAVNIYKQIVTGYHAHTSAIKALIRILTCTDKITDDTTKYTALGNYYLNVIQSYPTDTMLTKVSNELSHKVAVRKGQYEHAITGYENDIGNTADTLEILCYQLNIVEIYMLFEVGGDNHFTGKMPELKPASKLEGFKKIQELLHHAKQQKKDNVIPKQFALSQNYPNPFNPLTKINYSLPQGVKVSIKIYDILGKLVKELVNEYKDAGTYTVTFDGSNFASGVYFYKIEAGTFVNTKKMVLIK